MSKVMMPASLALWVSSKWLYKPKAVVLVFFLLVIKIVSERGIQASVTWIQDSYEDFIGGQFDSSGANLYATRKGTIETINRFDLNGDGYLDLVFNSSHDFITAPLPTCFELSGNRKGETKTCDLPANGTSLASVADLNKDGFPDLVLCPNDMWVSPRRYLWIFWGDSMGWSGRRITNLVTISPKAVQVADLNRDGWPEIIVLNGTRWAPEDGPEGMVRIYWGSSESFSHDRFSDVVIPRARDLKVSDLDDDGKPDLIILQSDPGSILIYWNDRIEFGAALPVPVSVDLKTSSASRLAVANNRGTRRADLFVSGGAKERIGFDPTTGSEIFRYSGILHLFVERSRAAGKPQAIPTLPASFLSVADLNEVGWPDAILTDSSKTKDSVMILWGNKEGQFQQQPITVLPVEYGSAVATEDLDGDGHLDVVIGVRMGPETYESASRVFYGDGQGRFVAAPFQIPTSDVTDVAVAPGSNGRGHRLVFCNNIAGRLKEDIPVMVYWGGSDGFDPSRVSKFSLRSGYVSCAADLNQDGYPDLILASIFHASEEKHTGVGFNILWGGKDGLKDDRRTVVQEYGLMGLNVADVDRDGYLDLIGSCPVRTPEGDPPRLDIWHGGPDGFDVQRRSVFPCELIRGQPAVADFNKDGYLDIAVGRDFANRFTIFWGSKAGFSVDRRSEWPQAAVEDIKVADLNGDGWLDLIAATYRFPGALNYDFGTYIYWGSPSGFDPTNVLRLPAYSAVGLTVADWDRDGQLDIYLPNYHYGITRESVASYLYWGSPKGYSEGNRTELTVDSGHGSMAADFNGDGRIDLAVSCHSRNGTHLTNSKVFYNDGKRFTRSLPVELPTIGSHYMQRADVGNLYDRSYRETYTSSVFSWSRAFMSARCKASVTTPGKSHLEWAMRSAGSKVELETVPWQDLGSQSEFVFQLPATARCLQYRAVFVSDNGDRYPVLDRFELALTNQK
jgi:hypothetical protein